MITLDLSKYRMITDVKCKNNKLLLEINKNYEVVLEIPYQEVEVSPPIIKINTHPRRAENIKIGILNLISYTIANNLKNKITKRRTIYINEPIPLIGHTAFGLIERGRNIIQVRGHCGCNLNCIFCSVDEGEFSKTRKNDYYVDLDYLISEYKKLSEFKENKYLEAHLDGQGEPSLYYPLVDLVQNLVDINKKGNGIVSMQTNGTVLSYKLIDELEEVGLHRINLSINALDEKMAKMLSGRKDYNVEKILDLAEYIKNSKIHLLVAPLLLPNVNDNEFKKVIDFAIDLEQKNPQNILNPLTGKKDPILGCQLCRVYQFGRRPKKMKIWDFERFYNLLRSYELEYAKKGIDVRLITSPKDFGTHKRKRLPYPFKVGEIVKAKVELDGRVKGEVLGVAKNRVIQIINCQNERKLIGKVIKVRILRNKDNIIVAERI
ncbi:Radical SAM domain protein [Methanocaldococcus vulcanius M7]|uniref:Radical SAM domain protein n=1 Tax=Methanocaldococcus vulcanius (strain ATCC 700851 / DSM 12094 / M7) TaxID=579137 RepID=C9RF54_METVM|nr:radical SAM protein [Methanocaldococcus vulcanius]ACX72206.1 Radical SAM domain protein [Methanocaldococcus vulcanius M7]